MTKKTQELFNVFIKELTISTGLDDTFKVLREQGSELLSAMGIAKWSSVYDSPSDSVNARVNKEETVQVINFDKADDISEVISKNYETVAGGSLGLSFYIPSGTILMPNDREDISMVMDVFFIALGRGRIFSSFEKANSTDIMTGLPNRVGLSRFLQKITQENRSDSYVAAFINIKNFRLINDKYGSSVGDRYLVSFAKMMMNLIEDDEIVARLGGDNFLMMFKKITLIDKDEKVKASSFDLEIEGEKINFKPKIRVGLYAMVEKDGMQEMMQGVATALQYARLPDTSDFVWYQSHMNELIMHMREVQDLFPKGLKNKEFVAYYQPKINAETLTLCGAEALCRWKREDRIIQPMDFVPFLEKDGSITKLDFYMLEIVCRDIADMSSRGINPGKISINFSKHHIHDVNFGDMILSIVDAYEVNHENIEIELTEMFEYDDFEVVQKFIDQMTKAGISTSLDDFGTGYSSLNMLTGLDADIIKLDKSFMDDIEKRPDKQGSMVKNIINMINELGMETLAEGVETKEQFLMLKNWNCRTIQGYLFDKPLSLEEFEKRILNPVYTLA